jgi:leader peptidase (prepilin peptidase)/N-methyltransferase
MSSNALWSRIKQASGPIWGALAAGLIATGAFTVSFATAPGPTGLLGGVLAILVAAIATIDLRSFTIPDWLNASAFGLALINAALLDPDALRWAIASALARSFTVAALFLLIRVAYFYVRGRQGVGLGDIKLAAVAGAWLDWLMLPLAVELAAFTAVSVYLFRGVVLRQQVGGTTRVPFGAFFAPAIWICWFFQMSSSPMM